jgi:uncharacterized membrane protein YeaQ/YmgE (transglycosylase-associated protein family)
MIGITLPSFLSLFVISAVCALVLHNILKPRLLGNGEGYLGQLIVGWLGAWIGSPVLGHWGWLIPSTTVYLVPAGLGALAAIYVVTESVKIIEFVRADISLRGTPVLPSEKNKVA